MALYHYLIRKMLEGNKINILRFCVKKPECFMALLLLLFVGERLYLPQRPFGIASLKDIQSILGITIFSEEQLGVQTIYLSETNEKEFVLSNTYSEPQYFLVKNMGKSSVETFISINESGWITVNDIYEKAFRDLTENPEEEEEILALWNYLASVTEHWYPPIYAHSERFQNVYRPLNALNAWGYGFCSDLSEVFSKLVGGLGYTSRMVYLGSHAVAEVYYEGNWHMFDLDRNAYYRNQGGEIASARELVDNPNLIIPMKGRAPENWFVTSNFSEFSSGIDYYEYTDSKITREQISDVFSYILQPKQEIYFLYDFKNKYFLNWLPEPWDGEEYPPNSLNGFYVTFVSAVERKKIGVRHEANKDKFIEFSQSGYPSISIYLFVDKQCQKNQKIDFKFEDDEDWITLEGVCKGQYFDFTDSYLENPIDRMAASSYSVRIPEYLSDSRLVTEFVINKYSLPVFKKGENKVTVPSSPSVPIKIEVGFSNKL